jgi:hypothetical protein
MYKIGDTIQYHTFGGNLRTVVVTDKLDDVKNGRPGFDGYLVGDREATVWGYDDQIVTAGPRLFQDGHRLGSAWR